MSFGNGGKDQIGTRTAGHVDSVCIIKITFRPAHLYTQCLTPHVSTCFNQLSSACLWPCIVSSFNSSLSPSWQHCPWRSIKMMRRPCLPGPLAALEVLAALVALALQGLDNLDSMTRHFSAEIPQRLSVCAPMMRQHETCATKMFSLRFLVMSFYNCQVFYNKTHLYNSIHVYISI